MVDFNGLGMSLGNLSRLSAAQTRSISAENSLARRVAAGWPPRVRAPSPPGSWARAGRFRPPSTLPAKKPSLSPISRDRAPSSTSGSPSIPATGARLVWRIVLGRRGDTVRRNAARAISSATAGASAATSPRCPSRSTPLAGSTAIGRCRFGRAARITVENLSPDPVPALYYQIDYTLTDVPDDCAYFTPSGGAVTPCRITRSTLSSTACRAGPVRRHLPRLGRQQHRLVGRRGDQVLPGWRQRLADHLRHRYGGLLRRRLELRAPAGRIWRLLHPVPRAASGDQTGRSLP